MNNIITFIVIYYLLGVIAQILGFISNIIITKDGFESTDNYVDDIGNFALLDVFLWFINVFAAIYYGIIEKEIILIITGISMLFPPIKIIGCIYMIIQNKRNK